MKTFECFRGLAVLMLMCAGAFLVSCGEKHLASAGRDYNDGRLHSVGWEGDYWSASTHGIYAYTLYFNSLHLVPDNYSHRIEALAVRCAKE